MQNKRKNAKFVKSSSRKKVEKSKDNRALVMKRRLVLSSWKLKRFWPSTVNFVYQTQEEVPVLNRTAFLVLKLKRGGGVGASNKNVLTIPVFTHSTKSDIFNCYISVGVGHAIQLIPNPLSFSLDNTKFFSVKLVQVSKWEKQKNDEKVKYIFNPMWQKNWKMS